MRIFSIAFLCALLCTKGYSQASTKSFQYDGLTRSYIEYVPSNYDGSTPYPVVIMLHGLGDNMNNFSNVGFHQVADTAGIIVLTPQAIVAPLLQAAAWNAGTALNGNIDDVGFINALIDTVLTQYNVDAQRIYAGGFSLGGFMTNRLACELNMRIAAFASVAGTIGNQLTCNPGRPLPICHIHGTADATVGYINNSFGLSAPDLIDFWLAHNNCSPIADSTDLPDLVADGITVRHYVYNNCSAGSVVEHYKAFGAGHVWLYPPVNDIFYTWEMWRFFSEHQLPANVGTDEYDVITFSVSPNPAEGQIHLENLPPHAFVDVYDLTGKVIGSHISMSTTCTFSMPSGIYVVVVRNEHGVGGSAKVVVK